MLEEDGNFLMGWSRKERLCSFPMPSIMISFPPQGRTTESPAPLQNSPHPRWGQDEGLCAHDPVPGVLGGGQALCTPAPQRQHDHGERQDQHHGTSSHVPKHLSAEGRLVPQNQKASPTKITSNEESLPSLTSRRGPLKIAVRI